MPQRANGVCQWMRYLATPYLEVNPGDLRGLAALLGHANLNRVMIYTESRLANLAERMKLVERMT